MTDAVERKGRGRGSVEGKEWGRFSSERLARAWSGSGGEFRCIGTLLCALISIDAPQVSFTPNQLVNVVNRLQIEPWESVKRDVIAGNFQRPQLPTTATEVNPSSQKSHFDALVSFGLLEKVPLPEGQQGAERYTFSKKIAQDDRERNYVIDAGSRILSLVQKHLSCIWECLVREVQKKKWIHQQFDGEYLIH